MSTHSVNVIRVEEIRPHPNADALELVPVWGYICAVKKGTFKVGDLAVFIEPDYEVPLGRPEFSFLQKPGKSRPYHRIAVSRLRGVYSQGLLIPAPEGVKLGDNVIDQLGIARWEPPETVMVKGAFAEKGPDIFAPKYDLENWRKYRKLLIPDEPILLTPKIHGTNARYLWAEGRMWCGSRTQWKRAPGSVVSGEIAPNNAWWEALKQNPWIEAWCKDNPGIVLYGEVFGPGIQPGFTYGLQPKQVGFVVFDILCKGQWVNNREFVQPNYAGLNFVPVIYDGPYSPSVVEELAEVNETFGNAGHIREGVVIKTHVERFDPEIGRIALKHVSNRYFEAK